MVLIYCSKFCSRCLLIMRIGGSCIVCHIRIIYTVVAVQTQVIYSLLVLLSDKQTRTNKKPLSSIYSPKSTP
ncbi:hypothetical protein JHK82_019222 [Glycine max]|uniref:Uncharacterized protein n=2 Tax=Glycine subgen. Soja TaxID=1462606 RepID=A0A0R0J9T9_SOYBN|nr:hypothetical protein JHK87_019091 [Glycine soja]KAG5023319.1 hypothetical protein JHK85_019661 [Glycine max]KAG5038402.1 hypothetical protein JHK86_019242 [Glycine max]KAG5143527.1 hypothetical protein JHK82_019222 [Glycine max]KAH1087602.1 hypothetical protein GYH30_018932 [Glycine max]